MSSEQPEMSGRSGSRISRISKAVGWTAAVLTALATALLLVAYLGFGDQTVTGEAITVFPPVLWLIPLIGVGIFCLFAHSWRACGLVLVCLMVFFLGTEEWVQLLRGKHTAARPIDAASLRVISWNIAGRTDWKGTLADMAGYNPDVVFLQETPDGDSSLTTASLTGQWAGFHWWDQGDCGILSRYELSPLESRRIGPWDKPAIATVQLLPGQVYPQTSRTIILCGVRMKMPAAATSGITNWDERKREHAERLSQYVELGKLASELRRKQSDAPVLIAGDFNVRGNSKSLQPLVAAGLADVWPVAGRGWGATFLADFPVARIDQIWTSGDLTPVSASAAEGSVSDHRMVIADINLRGD